MCLGRGEGPARLSDSRDSRAGRAVAESSSRIIAESSSRIIAESSSEIIAECSSLGVEIKQSSKAPGCFCSPTQKKLFHDQQHCPNCIEIQNGSMLFNRKLSPSKVSGWRRKQTNKRRQRRVDVVGGGRQRSKSKSKP